MQTEFQKRRKAEQRGQSDLSACIGSLRGICEKHPNSPNRTQKRHRNRKKKLGVEVEKGIRRINSSGKNTIKNGLREKKNPGQKAAGLN